MPIIAVSTGEAGDGWLCPMSSDLHDLHGARTFPCPAAGLDIGVVLDYEGYVGVNKTWSGTWFSW